MNILVITIIWQNVVTFGRAKTDQIKGFFLKKAAVSKEHNVEAEGLEIENLSITAGSKKGDGFACNILAIEFDVTLNGEKMTKNYIAKYTPEGTRREMLRRVI